MAGSLRAISPSVGPDLLDLLQDGVAVFDPDGALVYANRRFHALNPALGEFLDPGTPWDILLHEAGARVGYPDTVCAELGRAEEALANDPTAGLALAARLDDNVRYRFRLDEFGFFLFGATFALGWTPCRTAASP